MAIVGTVESLWRYPVKSMRGEQCDELFVGFAGVLGDRLYAFSDAARPKRFPFLTGRDQAVMLRYRGRFRHPERAAKPPNWAEAQEGLVLNPVPAQASDLAVDVETPAGRTLTVDDPVLLRELTGMLGRSADLTLLRSDKAITDCRPVSLFSIQTAGALGNEVGVVLDPRRFRANIFADLPGTAGFAEDEFVGRTIRVGGRVTIAVLERDPRCAMITIDPDTADRNTAVLARVTKAHDGMAGVYGAVLTEGVVRVHDPIEVVGFECNLPANPARTT